MHALSGQCTHHCLVRTPFSDPARLTCVGMGYDLHMSGMAQQHASCPVYMTLSERLSAKPLGQRTMHDDGYFVWGVDRGCRSIQTVHPKP